MMLQQERASETDHGTQLTAETNGLHVFLDQCHTRLTSGDTFEGMENLCRGLRARRAAVHPDEWRTHLIPICRRHPIQALLHHDPYTLRALQKPRGYAGDAVMLDYIYQRTPPEDTNANGRAIFDYTTRSPNALSVVARRDRLAMLIDRAAEVVKRPRILSVACGHLREAQISNAVRTGQVGAFFALDADPRSLEVVAHEQAQFGVSTVHASVKDLLRGDVRFSGLHLVYAAGLLDYLSDDAATALVHTMSRMLAPGGTLLIANFVPENEGAGYMEAFMDWHLIYRDEGDVKRIARDLPAPITRADAYRDPNRNIVMLEATRED